MGGYFQPVRIAALLLTIMALVFGVGSLRLGLWSDDGPGPGLMPFSAAVLLLPLIAALLFEDNSEDTPFQAEPLAAIACLGAYGLAVPRVGFLLPTVILLIVWVRFFHGQGWIKAAIVSITLTAAGVGLFGVLLKVPLKLMPGAA